MACLPPCRVGATLTPNDPSRRRTRVRVGLRRARGWSSRDDRQTSANARDGNEDGEGVLPACLLPSGIRRQRARRLCRAAELQAVAHAGRCRVVFPLESRARVKPYGRTERDRRDEEAKEDSTSRTSPYERDRSDVT